METTETDIFDIFDFPIQHFPDRSARWLLQDKENVRGLMEIVAAQLASHIDFTQLAQLNRSFVSDTLREQESDIIFSVPFRAGSETEELLIYILIEHQSTVDATMGFRVLFYMTQIWDSQRREWASEDVPKSEWRLRPILPIVFYTGAQRWNSALSLTGIMDIPDALARFVPTFDTLFLSVKEMAASDLTRTDHPFGWLLTVLQQEHADKDIISSALQQAMTHLSELGTEQSEQLRRSIAYLILLILHRRPVEERDDLLTIVNDYTDEMEVGTMADAIAGTLFEQGVEQGEARARRADVLKLLQSQFGDIPESLVTQINAMQNPAELDTLFDAVLDAETIDDIHLQNGDTR
ncbi:MAG: Rpn family recombination-promoting nuclease/putative transposase [Candidatus Poribacteria bacterium]|nr:Rpn family recombination-promoting nuclease/putative transposase [Candidatus Poribacteria bacterium]